jgi:hypothetical protein
MRKEVPPYGQAHPGAGALTRFARGKARGREDAAVMAHLMQGCRSCAEALAREDPGLAPMEPPGGGAAEPAGGGAEPGPGEVRKERRLRSRARALAPRAVAALERLPWRRKLLALRNRAALQGWTGCEALIAESVRVRPQSPGRAVELCLLAFRGAVELPQGGMPLPLAADCQALAAAEVANAYRVADRPDPAIRFMGLAFVLLSRGTGNRRAAARVWDLAGSLLRDRRQLDLASRLLARVCRAYLQLGDLHLAGRALVKQATVEYEAGRPWLALGLVARACRLLDPGREPLLVVSVFRNFLSFAVELGDYAVADRLLRKGHSLFALRPGRRSQLHLTWLEARIAAGLGRPREAEAKLLEAKNGFARSSAPYDAALAALDLAQLLGREGRALEVELLVREMLAAFRRLRVGREAVAALLTLREALGRRRVPLTLIQQVAEFLRRYRQDSGLRFAGRGRSGDPAPTGGRR